MDSMAGWTEQPLINGIAGDRRDDRRYGIQLELRWKLIRRGRVLDNGSGLTLDLSSGGVLFDASRQLPVGLNVELAVLWPVLLHNAVPLQLVVSGRIVRSAGNQSAVRMVEHGFRTMPSSDIRRSGRQLACNSPVSAGGAKITRGEASWGSGVPAEAKVFTGRGVN